MAEDDMSVSGGIRDKDCSLCGQKVPYLQEWQSVTGQVFIGHRQCAEAEAAKYVMVERSMLQRIAHDPCEHPQDDGEPCDCCCTAASIALEALGCTQCAAVGRDPNHAECPF